MTRAEAINKVKKLLRLGKSSNEHEAAAAMRQAQALMRQHAVDDGDVQDQAQDEMVAEETAAFRGSKPPPYAIAIGNTVAIAFGCEFMFLEGRHKHIPTFIGPQSRAQISAYAYAVLLRQLERDKRAHISRVRVRKNRSARGDAFGLGWATGVHLVLQSWDVPPEEQQEMKAFLARKYPSTSTVAVKPRQSKAVSHNDHWRGREKGREAQLHRGIGGSQAKQKMLGAS